VQRDARDRPLDLDVLLADPVVRIRHRRTALADAGALWDAATSLRLDETGPLGRLGPRPDACGRVH
jgi:hypothetical protein